MFFFQSEFANGNTWGIGELIRALDIVMDNTLLNCRW